MTSGTRVLLAIIGLFIGVLVIYYGFVLPEDDPAADVVRPAVDPAAEVARPATKGTDLGAVRGSETRRGGASEGDAGRAVAPGRMLSRAAEVPVESPASSRPRAEEPATGAPVLPRSEARLPIASGPPSNTDATGAPGASERPSSGTDASGGAATTGAATPDPASGDTAGGKPGGMPAEGSSTRSAAAGAAPGRSAAVDDSRSAPRPQGPAPAADSAGGGAPRPPSYTSYTVKEGDTMTSIAAAWFGDERKWDLIAKANLVDPNRLSIGQTLRLPPKTMAREPLAECAGSDGKTYVVRSGDTLSSIAESFYGDGVQWKLIYRANRDVIGREPNVLEVGMKLSIPPAPKPEAKPGAGAAGK